FSIRSAKNSFFQHILYFICLPYEAFLYTHAILITFWRMFISGKKLLEWNASSNSSNHSASTLFQTYLTMWFAPVLSTGLFIYFTFYAPLTLITAMPVMIVWA